MAVKSMRRSLPAEPSETKPSSGFGTISEGNQRAWRWEPRTFLEWREVVYGALRKAVSDHYTKQGEFADAIGVSNGEASRRLNHSPDEKTGRPQLAYLDYLVTLCTRPEAFETFAGEVLREKGKRIEGCHPPTDEETWRALASEMTDKQKRRLEQEREWPRGWLDR